MEPAARGQAAEHQLSRPAVQAQGSRSFFRSPEEYKTSARESGGTNPNSNQGQQGPVVSLMPAKRELVSILIPIFNEEDGVELLKEKLLGLQNLLENEYELEFLFIDDGSSDLTVPRLRKSFRDAAITTRILQHGVNQGV